MLSKPPDRTNWSLHLRGAGWWGNRWPDHVNFLTPQTLAAKAEDAGLVVERMNWLDPLVFSDSLYAVLRSPAR